MPLFFIVYFGHKLFTKSQLIPLGDVDLVSDTEAEAFGEVTNKTSTLLGKLWASVV